MNLYYKKYFTILILFISSINIFAYVASFPLVDEAKTIDHNNFKIGGGFGFTHKVLILHNSFTKIETNLRTPIMQYSKYECYDDEYCYDNDYLYYSPFNMVLLLPRHYLSFNFSKGLKNNAELGFAFYLCTPDVNFPIGDINFVGPTFQAQFLFKKQIINSAYIAGSYKFSLIAEYNGALGINAGIKNSILLGSNDDYKTFNFIFSIYAYFGYSLFNYYLNSNDVLYTGVIPQLEFCWSKTGKNNFNYSSSIFLESNIKYIFYHEMVDYSTDDFQIIPTYDKIIQIKVNIGYEFKFQRR